MFFVTMAACVAASLAIGVRPPAVSVVVLLAFPPAYRFLALKQRPWRLTSLGAALFVATSLAWLIPAMYMGSGGPDRYRDDVAKQWSAAVKPYDFAHIDSPWPTNLLYRVERFFLGYLVTHAWTGSDDKTLGSLLLTAPWIFELALFALGFRASDPADSFVLLWLLSLAYTVLVIHFLPRYGLAHLPGVVVACMMGYKLLTVRLLRHPRRLEVLALAGIGSVLLMYGIKYQPPVGAFESTPPATPLYAGVFVLAGVAVLGAGRWLALRHPAPEGGALPTRHVAAVVVFLAALIPLFAANGYAVASTAHGKTSPSQQLVEFVSATFDTRRVTPCWDNQTHSFFEALAPNAAPAGYRRVEELYRAYERGQTLLVSDKCKWFKEIDDSLGLNEIGRFDGASPLWSKTPSVRLYTVPGPTR